MSVEMEKEMKNRKNTFIKFLWWIKMKIWNSMMKKIKQRWKNVKTDIVEWVWVFNTGREKNLPSPQPGFSDAVTASGAHFLIPIFSPGRAEKLCCYLMLSLVMKISLFQALSKLLSDPIVSQHRFLSALTSISALWYIARDSRRNSFL